MGEKKKVIFEGYGPGGAAIYLDVMTDNQDKSWQNLKSLFKQYDGAIGLAGAKPFMFQERTMLTHWRENGLVGEDMVMLVAIGAGAEEVLFHPDRFDIIVESKKSDWVEDILSVEDVEIHETKQVVLPKKTTDVIDKVTISRLLELVEKIKECGEEVQVVVHNGEFPERD